MLNEDEEFELLSLERERGGGGLGGKPMAQNMGPTAEPMSKLVDYNPAVGTLETAANLATGGLSSIGGGLAGLAGTVLPGPEGQGADWARRIQAAGTYEPKTKAGQTISTALGLPFEALAKGSNIVGEKVTDVSGSPAAGALSNAAIQALPMVLPWGVRRAMAARAVDPAEAMFDTSRPAPKMAPETGPAERAREAGLKLTPSEGGGGFITKNLESFAGEPALSRKISKANEPTTEKVLSADLPGSMGEINPDALASVRQKANAGYQAARNSGHMIADGLLDEALNKAVAKFRQASESFPDNPIIKEQLQAAENAIKGMDSPVMNADATITVINGLREEAKKAWNGTAMDKELAPVKRDVAKALEDQIERHLIRTKQSPDIIKNFREARTILAKAAEAEDAAASGTVNPQFYARKFQESNHGGMTGGALQVGEAAANFPRSMRNPRNVGNPHGPTATDAVMSAVAHSVLPGMGRVADLLSMGSRPAIRALLASRLGQSMIGKPIVAPAATAMQYGTIPGVAQESAEEAGKAPQGNPSSSLSSDALDAISPMLGIGTANAGDLAGYQVVNTRTGQTLGYYPTLKRAHSAANKHDLDYGATTTVVRRIPLPGPTMPGK